MTDSVLKTTLTFVFADPDTREEVDRVTIKWIYGTGIPDIVRNKGELWILDERLAEKPNTFRYILASTLDLGEPS